MVIEVQKKKGNKKNHPKLCRKRRLAFCFHCVDHLCLLGVPSSHSIGMDANPSLVSSLGVKAVGQKEVLPFHEDLNEWVWRVKGKMNG